MLRAIRNLLMSTVAASVTLCISIERVEDATSNIANAAVLSCGLAGVMHGIERPGWHFFEPTSRDGVVHVEAHAETVSKAFTALNYDLDRVRDGDKVPRLILARLPRALGDIDSIAARKAVFIGALLPVALYINERVLLQRRALETLRECERRGVPVDARAETWVRTLAELYDEEPVIERLLLRVDAVPPSLLLAQAAVESGWGTSKFAQAGNALFGEYTFRFADAPEVRARSSKKRAYIRTFEHVIEAALSYVRNLNTHPAYEGFRAQRAELRSRGQELDGLALVDEIVRYSTRRQAYVREIGNVIRANRLDALDDARLAKSPTRWMTSDIGTTLTEFNASMPAHDAGT